MVVLRLGLLRPLREIGVVEIVPTFRELNKLSAMVLPWVIHNGQEKQKLSIDKKPDNYLMSHI